MWQRDWRIQTTERTHRHRLRHLAAGNFDGHRQQPGNRSPAYLRRRLCGGSSATSPRLASTDWRRPGAHAACHSATSSSSMAIADGQSDTRRLTTLWNPSCGYWDPAWRWLTERRRNRGRDRRHSAECHDHHCLHEDDSASSLGVGRRRWRYRRRPSPSCDVWPQRHLAPPKRPALRTAAGGRRWFFAPSAPLRKTTRSWHRAIRPARSPLGPVIAGTACNNRWWWWGGAKGRGHRGRPPGRWSEHCCCWTCDNGDIRRHRTWIRCWPINVRHKRGMFSPIFFIEEQHGSRIWRHESKSVQLNQSINNSKQCLWAHSQ